MSLNGGDPLEQPAKISIADWEQHRGELAAVSGRVAAVPALTAEVRTLSSNVALLRGTVAEFRVELREQRGTVARVREDSSSDLRAELDRYKAEASSRERDAELERLRAEDQERRSRWRELAMHAVKIIIAAGVGGALTKLLHL